MKGFLAYRSGEDPALLSAVIDALRERGATTYCTWFDKPKFREKGVNAGVIMEHAFSVIEKSDLLFVLQTSNVRSEGMLMEVGCALALKTPIIVATMLGVEHTCLPQMTSVFFEWTGIKDLREKTQEVRLPATI